MEPIIGLAGLHFIANEGETYSVGEVIASVGPGAYLVRFEGRRNKLPMHVALVSDMIGDPGTGWEFFRTRAELDAWISLVDGEPEGPRIVTFPKK